MEQLEGEKPLVGVVLGGAPHFGGFYPLELYQILMEKSPRRSSCGSGRGRGRISIMIYILREFSIAKSSWGKGASLSLDSSRLPVSCKGEKEVVKNPSAGTQACYMTES